MSMSLSCEWTQDASDPSFWRLVTPTNCTLATIWDMGELKSGMNMMALDENARLDLKRARMQFRGDLQDAKLCIEVSLGIVRESERTMK